MSSGRGLPMVLRTKTYERPEDQDVNTDLLYPVNFNTKGAKFVFDKKGVLDSNSQINLRQTCNQVGGAEMGCYLPTSTGALAMIKRAWLTIGGKRVSNLESVGHYSTWKRLHWSNEYRQGIANPKQGGDDVYVGSASRAIADQSTNNFKRSRGFAPPFGALGRVSSSFATLSATGVQNADETDTGTASHQIITSVSATSPDFVVGLSQLIPFLIGIQLPLFAIREEVALHLEWADDGFGHRFCVPQANAGQQNFIKSTVVREACYIMADYLFFPNQMDVLMDEMMTKGGYDIPYDEIQIQESTEPALIGPGALSNDIQLPLGGKKVKSVVLQQQITDGANIAYSNIGRYNSVGLRLGSSLNLTVDSKPFYSKALSNNSLKLCEANQVEGVPLQLCDYRYSWKNQVDAAGAVDKFGLTDRKFNGYPSTNEAGTMNWVGVKIENSLGEGVRVSNLPMIWNRKSNNVAADDNGDQRTLRFFIKTHRMLNISRGIATVIE